MNWVKKHLKWIILGITFLIIVIIALIDYKQIYVALTLIPSVLLSLLQSNNEKQEKLADIGIAEKENKQKEKEEENQFDKKLRFVFKVCQTVMQKCNFSLNNQEEAKYAIETTDYDKKYEMNDRIIQLDGYELHIKNVIPASMCYNVYFKNISNNKSHVEEICCKLLDIKIEENVYISSLLFEGLGKLIARFLWNHNTIDIPNMVNYKYFLEQINKESTKDGLIEYKDILKQELPKILTPDVFDGEKLIVKDE